MRRRIWCVLLIAMILPVFGLRGAAVSETGLVRATPEWEGEAGRPKSGVEQSSAGSIVMGEEVPVLQPLSAETPPTGQHPAPILSAMVLVFAGVALLLCLDWMTKK